MLIQLKHGPQFLRLTVTKVVFEYNPAIDVELPKIRLTVTKVVFEY